MGEWNRSTRRLLREDIKPEMQAAIKEHIESFNLEPILDDHLICIETVSDRKKKGLFGGGLPKHTIQAVVLTTDWLVISTQSEKHDSPAVLSVQLKDAVIEDYPDSPNYKILPDNGLNVTGIFTGRVGMAGNQRITAFIALGEEPAANEFKDTLFQSAKNARN